MRLRAAPLARECERLVANGTYTWSDIAYNCGMTVSSKQADTARLLRVLGLKPGSAPGARVNPTKQLSEATVHLILRAISKDPVDVGY